MTVTRVVLAGIRYKDSRGGLQHLVPLSDPDGGWWVLQEDGASTFESPTDLRQYVASWEADALAEGNTDVERESIDAHLALAELLDELEADHG